MKQINDRLFAVDLNSQYNIDMLLLDSACYIVCNNKSDTNEAKQIATFLHKEGMREINLFGAFKQTWSDVFDQVDIESIGFNKLSTMMFCDLTATILYDDLDKFAREIVSSTRFGNAYIFFDDEKIYNEIIEKIK